MPADLSHEKFDIVVIAGQSNADGYGVGTASAPVTQDDRVLYMDTSGYIFRGCETVSGNQITGNFPLAFCREYIASGRLLPGRKLLVVRASVGGTGFADRRWGLEDDLYLHMMQMTSDALSLSEDSRIVAMLWHQGETDAIFSQSYDAYRGSLTALLSAFRGRFGLVPFVCAGFVPLWISRNSAVCEPILRAQRDICAASPLCAFVESDGLLSNDEAVKNGDDIHFCRESLNLLGARYFEAFSRL